MSDKLHDPKRPQGPFVTDEHRPGRVYCDDDVGTIVAQCTFEPDCRLRRYDGLHMAERVATLLTLFDGVDDPQAWVEQVRTALTDAEQSLSRLPDTEGAYRVTVLNNVQATLANVVFRRR